MINIYKLAMELETIRRRLIGRRARGKREKIDIKMFTIRNVYKNWNDERERKREDLKNVGQSICGFCEMKMYICSSLFLWNNIIVREYYVKLDCNRTLTYTKESHFKKITLFKFEKLQQILNFFVIFLLVLKYLLFF